MLKGQKHPKLFIADVKMADTIECQVKIISQSCHFLMSILYLLYSCAYILGKLNLAIFDVTYIFYHLRAILDISFI